MKNSKLLYGIILANLLYLAVFYLVYFITVGAVFYAKNVITTNPVFSPYVAMIPASTNYMMDFLIFVVVPLAALIWTMWSSTQPQYVQQ